MSDDARRDLVGTDALPVVNHEWWDDGTFAHVGTLGPDTVKTR
jgi:hypothetical protein